MKTTLKYIILAGIIVGSNTQAVHASSKLGPLCAALCGDVISAIGACTVFRNTLLFPPSVNNMFQLPAYAQFAIIPGIALALGGRAYMCKHAEGIKGKSSAIIAALLSFVGSTAFFTGILMKTFCESQSNMSHRVQAQDAIWYINNNRQPLNPLIRISSGPFHPLLTSEDLLIMSGGSYIAMAVGSICTGISTLVAL